MLSPSSLCYHLNSILHRFSLVQIVTEPTHIKHDGSSSLLDLVITSTPEAVSTCSTLPPLANSDHYGVLINFQCKLVRVTRKRRFVWRYEHADFTLTCALLRCFDFGHLFDGRSIDMCWTQWNNAFLEVMNSCIPKAILPERKSPTWMSKKIVQLIRKRNYRRSGNFRR